MSQDPETFRKALLLFMDQVWLKAVERAKQEKRPMDPWNVYEPEFIRGRLIEEIGKWLAKFTVNDNEGNNGIEQWEAENDELYDIVALACSVWMTHEGTTVNDAKPGSEGKS